MFNLFFFFFNDTATTEIYTLSLHDALPIFEDLFQFAARLQKEHGLAVAAFGHAGDGNIHVNIMVDRASPGADARAEAALRSEEHTSELQSQSNLVCRLLLEKKKITNMSEGD